MRARALCLLLLTTAASAVACGEPFSNDDVAFLEGLPNRTLVRFQVPTATAGQGLRPNDDSGNPGSAAFYRDALNAGVAMNHAIDGALNLVDKVVVNPPTSRDTAHDRLIWTSPVDPRSGIQYELIIERLRNMPVFSLVASTTITTTVFAFDFHARNAHTSTATWLSFIGGAFAPLGGDRRGAGGIQINFDNAKRIGVGTSTTDAGVITVAYHTEGMMEVLYGKIDASPDPRQVGDIYVFAHDDRSGIITFLHDFWADVDSSGNTAREHIRFYDRWLPDHRGRADVLITDGDLPMGFKAYLSECWDQSFTATFLVSDIPTVFPPFGTEAAGCPAEFVEMRPN